MAGGFGGAVKLTGESEYRKALKQITDNLTVLSSEMKVVNSMYDKNDASTEKLTQSNDVLTKKLEEQNKKLSEAKKMLDEARNSTDSNAQTVAKWQNEVNKAQAEVNRTTKEIKANTEQMKKNENAVADVGDELGDFAKNEDTAGKGAIKLGDLIKANVISSAIIGGVKALGSAMASLAKGVFELGKQAIESFAEYEQLVGGVDTLFKESSGKVQEYANNAFKTAGLTANEYMNTVTSFSASLISSLGGDVTKSAEVANMAITDMADNANKMGTDIQSIQNAYQGFAKGQFNMLDNLKLGYGGNKTEMERLLADATALSGIEYDISSFADISEAIHVIQIQIGITGTTAKEASETIQGSVSAMKSAWGNLLTGLADKNANLNLLINNLVESVSTVGDNILPLIPTVIESIGRMAAQLVSKLVPQIVSTIPQLIADTLPTIIEAANLAITSILSVLPQVAQSFGALLPEILNTMVGMLPAIIDAGVQIILSLAMGIAQSLPTLIPTVIDAVLTVVENLIDNIDLVIDAGIQLIIGLAEGLMNALPVLIDHVPTIITKLLSALSENLPKLVQAGIELTVQLSVGFIKALPQLVAKIPEIISGVVSAFADYYKDLFEVGVNLLKGLWAGIASWVSNLWQNIKNLGGEIVKGFKSVFGIASPSKVFADQVGKNMALGLGKGFEDTMKNVTNEMSSAVPTNFDLSATTVNRNVVGTDASGVTFERIVEALKQALKEVNIVLDDEVAGRFVTDTVEKAVYA